MENFAPTAAHILEIVSLLIICMLLHYGSHRLHLHWLPECVLYIAVGFIVGVIEVQMNEDKSKLVTFDPWIFFFALLPPIILGAGYTLKRKRFMKNMTTILVFAVFGTLVSTIVIGLGLYMLYYYHILDDVLTDFGILDALVYGSLISAVDPVATLAILGSKDVNADKTLYSIVFGESVLNDAVCIVMFDILITLTEGSNADTFTGADALDAIGQFFLVSIGSIALGVVFGLATSFLFKNTYMDQHPSIEFLLVVMSAYSAYLLAEVLQISGVMSIFVCGIVLAHYNWYNLSRAARASTRHGLAGIAMAAETFVFIYIGIMTAVCIDSSFHYQWSFKLICYVLLLCFFSRALHIFIFSALLNIGRKTKITLGMQIVMWFAGLRGAIAFALVLNVGGPNGSVLQTTTLAVVLFTTIVCGSLTEKLVNITGVRSVSTINGAILEGAMDHRAFMQLDDHNRSQESADTDGYMHQGAVSGMKMGTSTAISRSFHAFFSDFDNKYMKPYFGGHLEDRSYRLDNDLGDVHSILD